MENLDNPEQIAHADKNGALLACADQWQQLTQELNVHFYTQPERKVRQLVIAGMGGSGLASGLAHDWLPLQVPVTVVKTYDLPTSVDANTLVIVSSFSGNTEETISCAKQAQEQGAILAITAGGGKLVDMAQEQQVNFVQLPKVTQPRMGVFANLSSIIAICKHYGLVPEEIVNEFAGQADWLRSKTADWLPEKPGDNNLAKQIALHLANKTGLVFASSKFAAIAYKWKISINETGKNVAYFNELPEFDHNELTGWTSHPLEKPFAIIQLRSSLDHPQINKRFDVVERLLDGRMPTPLNVQLQGDTMLQQILWGCLLADFATIYLALLNGADPTTPVLVEELKREL